MLPVTSPTRASPEDGTLLIWVDSGFRRVVKMKVDRVRACVELKYKSLSIGSHLVTLHLIGIHYDPNGNTLLGEFKLDISVLPYLFSIKHLVGGKQEDMHLIAFDPAMAEFWSQVDTTALRDTAFQRSAKGIQNDNISSYAPLRDSGDTDKANFLTALLERAFANSDSDDEWSQEGACVERDRGEEDAADGEEGYFREKGGGGEEADSGHGATGTKGASSPVATASEVHYWTDWPFMLRLTDCIWDAPVITNLDQQISMISELEEHMKPLEATEYLHWQQLCKPAPGDRLDSDEFLEYCDTLADTSVLGEDGLKMLAGMHSLQRLRHKKAHALDSLRIEATVSVPNRTVATSMLDSHILPSNVVEGERMWAIIIGIDRYVRRANLSGCVNDARLMVEYLTLDLGVPVDHIVVLTSPRNEDQDDLHLPTRVNILNSLYTHFRDNDRIRHGDNLLFHFSGHGTSYVPVKGISRGTTEALCPMDRSISKSSPPVDDISDRELNVIFFEISERKGPNLTVILDCCYSGGATRVAIDDAPAIRSTTPMKGDAVLRMFRSASQDPRRIRPVAANRDPLSNSFKADMSSHVLLAACGSYETAKETRVSHFQYDQLGVFTFALVSALRSPHGVDPAVTYVELIDYVIERPLFQTFIVAGKRKRSRLWFTEADAPKTASNTQKTD